jgi:hypothetical protein
MKTLHIGTYVLKLSILLIDMQEQMKTYWQREESKQKESRSRNDQRGKYNN